MTIRLTNKSDINELCELRIALLKESGDISNKNSVEKLREEIKAFLHEEMNKTFYCYVAENELGELVATGGISLIQKPPTNGNITGKEGYIMNIYVKPSFRGKGIASKIMRHIHEFLINKGIKKMTLIATKDGRHLYEKMGYTDIKNYMVYKDH